MLGTILYLAAAIYWFFWLDLNLTLYSKKTNKTFDNKSFKVLLIKALTASTWIISFPIYILPLRKNQNRN